jgi:hypothetical protein
MLIERVLIIEEREGIPAKRGNEMGISFQQRMGISFQQRIGISFQKRMGISFQQGMGISFRRF